MSTIGRVGFIIMFTGLGALALALLGGFVWAIYLTFLVDSSAGFTALLAFVFIGTISVGMLLAAWDTISHMPPHSPAPAKYEEET